MKGSGNGNLVVFLEITDKQGSNKLDQQGGCQRNHTQSTAPAVLYRNTNDNKVYF